MQSTVQSVLNTKELRSTCSKGLEVPCQDTFKDKPAFIKRLIKVPVARDLYMVHSSSCRNKTCLKATMRELYKFSTMNLLQCMI